MKVGASGNGAGIALQNEQLLSVRDIRISFGDLVAVKDVSFEVRDGEILGLIGENGAGKSSLLKILAGVYKQDQGTIEVQGKIVKMKSPKDALAAGIGVVHQEQSLFTNLSVAENIYVNTVSSDGQRGLYTAQNWRKVNAVASEALKKINSNLDPRTKVGDLSFVNRQMVEIARAMQVGNSVGKKPLVILDEPTSLLEPHETAVLERELLKIKEYGAAIFVSHRLDEVIRICDRIIVMRDGEIVATRQKSETNHEELFQLLAGREWRTEKRKVSANADSEIPILELDKVTLKGAFKAVDLKLFAGRICSIVGTNGSGRDELCKLAFGAISSTSGSIYIRGQKVHKWNIVDAIAAGIGFVPAERKVEGMIPGLSAAANLSLIFDQDSKFGPLTITSKEIAVADQWFEKLDVRPRKPRENLDRFSGGNQQKVVIAKWLKSEDLSLLVLDHPLRGLDPGAAGTVNQLIKDAALSGTAILLVGDTLEEALQMSDEIIVMKDGEISAHFDLHNQQPSTFDLLERMV